MKILYKAPFRKFVKKQTRPFQLAIEDEVEKIADDPDICEAKKGDIAGYRVHKFTFKGIQALIAYFAQKEEIIFYMIGPHENFYRKLKQYLKEAKWYDYSTKSV